MNIFVAKLNFKTSEDALRRLFEGYGEVSSAKIIMDRDTGRSKGYGFVEMTDDEAARQAIADLNDQEFDERVIVVKEAEERPRRRRDDFGFDRGRRDNFRGGGDRRDNFRGGDRRDNFRRDDRDRDRRY